MRLGDRAPRFDPCLRKFDRDELARRIAPSLDTDDRLKGVSRASRRDRRDIEELLRILAELDRAELRALVCDEAIEELYASGSNPFEAAVSGRSGEWLVAPWDRLRNAIDTLPFTPHRHARVIGLDGRGEAPDDSAFRF